MIKTLNAYRAVLVSYSLLALGLALILLATVLELRGWADVLRTLGSALIPASLVSLAYEHYLRSGFLAEVRESITQLLQKEFSELGRLKKIGITDTFSVMPTHSVAAAFANAARRIWILQTWIPDLVELEKQFVPAAKNGATIRLLLMHPHSVHSTLRSIELGFPNEADAAEAARSNLKEISRFCKETGVLGKVDVRLYNDTPTIPMYFCDDEVVVGWFWKRQMCIQGPHIKAKGTDALLVKEMERYFTIVWDRAEPVDLEETKSLLHLVESGSHVP